MPKLLISFVEMNTIMHIDEELTIIAIATDDFLEEIRVRS